MSMHVGFYLGPYLEVSLEADREMIERFSQIVAGGRGEASNGDKFHYLIPNRKVPGIDRNTHFDDDETPEPIPAGNLSVVEVEKFSTFVRPFLTELCKLNIDYNICWGVVCGIF